MGGTKTLTWPIALGYAAVSVLSFHLAFAVGWSGFIILFLFGLGGLTNLDSGRKAFYFGVVIGLLVYVPHLAFFWNIFRWTAAVLWLVPSFWLGLFIALGRTVRLRFGALGLVMIPFLWTGIEYFRSELYYLKFSWLSVGYAFSNATNLAYMASVGVYGIGFCAMLVVVAVYSWRSVRTFAACLGILAFVLLTQLLQSTPKVKGASMRVAGIQMEFPAGSEVPKALDKALAASPNADVLLLSEYTFHSPVPNFVRKWCVNHKKYLIVGGTEDLPNGKFYDMAYVIGPNGDVVFKQAKCVPVQFFNDGLSAPEQKLWESPWGKVGLGICYDCSYRRVTDELVQQGAQVLIFPTMDVVDWGAYQHRLHSRVGPMRAAEFGIAVVRIASSGISQIVGRDGTVSAEAGFPGEGSTLVGAIGFGAPGRLPLDHWLAPACTGIAAVTLVFLVAELILTRKMRAAPQQPPINVPVAKV
ncbi:MAG: nitrilase-related carbon-nitrogen hydrolase [Limisphaerales bacterium]